MTEVFVDVEKQVEQHDEDWKRWRLVLLPSDRETVRVSSLLLLR